MQMILGLIYEWFYHFSRELNVNVLAYDYEGYGKALGNPNEKSCYDDIDAAYNYLTNILNQSPNTIILYGRSLGMNMSLILIYKLINTDNE